MHLRARYGHGGRPGYDREWRARPGRSGGGELIDQGMHLLDLVHWLAGPLPLHSALLRTQFWDTPVEDNAALILEPHDDRSVAVGDAARQLDGVEEHCSRSRSTAGPRSCRLMASCGHTGPQRLRIYRMSPELGPPRSKQRDLSRTEDQSWRAEWEHFAAAIAGGRPLLGGLRRRPLRVATGGGRLRRVPAVRRGAGVTLSYARGPLRCRPSASSPAALGTRLGEHCARHAEAAARDRGRAISRPPTAAAGQLRRRR